MREHGPRSTRRRAVVRVVITLSLAAAMLTPLVGVAHAACHAFTVEADPSTPTEGQTVTVTIRRDADVQPSSVRVRTVDGTATGGVDYTELDERVEFAEGTEETRQIEIFDDDEVEDSETFDIELSEGEGCEVNQNFSYDSVTVTIEDDDEPAAQESPATGESPATEETSTTDDTDDAGATDDDLPDTGSGGLLVVLGLLGLLAAAASLRGRPPRRH